MDEVYDVIVLGTGLKECIISGMCSCTGQKVLHMDRNTYYGGESASMNPLEELYKKFGKNIQTAPESMLATRGRDWNVDLIPKFLMSNGELVKLLITTDVTKYLEFKVISGSFVFKKGGKVHKVPATETEAVTTGLMGMFEKRKFKKMLQFSHEYKDGPVGDINPEKICGKEFFEKFGVDKNTQEFTGHVLALYTDESYQEEKACELINKIKLYSTSLEKYGSSPFLFPLYGLGELPQGFARLSAIYGGTYMLDKKIDEIVYGDDGKVCGVKSGNETAACKKVVCDPTYAKEMCEVKGKVIRAICILNQGFPKLADSFQLIMPSQQVGRKNDIYIMVLSSAHNVCPKGFYIAIMSTIVETSNPERELDEAFKLIPSPLDTFVSISDLYEPLPEAESKGVYITKSYDATSHFQTTCWDVMAVVHKMGIPWEEYAKEKEKKDAEKKQNELEEKMAQTTME